MADKVTSLYNALKADGLFKQARSLNDFKAKMAYQGYRSQIYKLARDKGANVGTFSQFTNALGYSSGSPKPRQSYGSYHTQQQKPATAAQKAMQIPYRLNTQLGKAPKNASPFVQSLYEMDDAQKGAGYPVDYTSPKATQQVYQRNQRIRRQAAKTAAKKISRQASHAQPIMQTNTPADIYIGKTEGQLMDEMNQSANALVGSEMGDYLDKVIGDEFKAAHARGLATLSANSGVHGTGGADWWIGERAYQNQMDQDKQLQEITGNIQKNIESIFSNPKVKQRVLSDAQKLGVSPETYIESSLAPALIEKAGKQFNNTQLNRMMAKGASDYIASGILNSLTGTLLMGLTSTKSQRQMQQQADAMTEEGLNPNYKPGTWAKAAKGAVAFAADAPLYNLAGVGAGALTEKVFGNAAQQMARVANQSLRQRVFEGVARGIVHGGATGFQYGAINGAVQNYSTGEDTSLWGTLKAAAKGGLEEGVSFATMEGMGGAVGAFGHGIGLKGTEKTWKQRVNKMGQKLTYEGIKTGMEGIGMATGGVASSYANHILTGDDWHGFSTEGTLESCASAVIFKLTHAKDLFKKETDRNGKPFSFTSNIAQKTARFFLSGEAKSAPHVFSDEEKHQLFAAGSELGMKPMENIVSWAKQAKKYRAEDIEKSEDGSDLLNNYQQIMQDPNVSWDAKAKFTTMVMGTMPESRPMMDHISYGTEDGTDGDNRIHTYKTVNEYAADGTLLSKHRFDTKDKRESIIYEIGVRKEELRSKNALALLVGLDRNNYDLQNSFFKKNAKDWEQVQEIVEGMQTGGSKTDHQFTEYVLNSESGSFLPIVDAVANKNGMDRESMLNAFYKDPMKRTDEEQNACVQLRKAIEMEVFPANKVHEEQSVMDGKDVATDNNLGTMQPEGGAVKAELDGLRQAEAGMDELMRDNDVFGQNFQKLKQQGLTNPQIYDWMVQQGGLTVEQLEPFAHYINANARVQGMQEATKNAIDEQVSSYVQDWSFHGTLNGQEKNGEQAIYVQDSNGRTLLVGTGEVAFDTTTGRAKEGVGDMLVCLDPKSGETVYVKSDEVKFVGTQSTDDFANGYRQELQMKNSEPYNQAAQEQEMQDAAKPQPVEKSKDDATKGGDLTKDDTTLTKVDTTSGKDNTTSEDLVPQEQPQTTRKFADGSDVPMTKDSKGRPTPDYEKMTPEQSAEILTEDFGKNAEKVVDGQIQKAEKALKDAEKMKVDYTAEPNDIMEQEALKAKTVEAAKKQLEHAQNIKKTMTAKKVAETVGNTEQAEGAHEAGSVAAQKFENAPRLVGNKRTRMLADGETKIRGHYEIVPAESLTPSHDVNNGYKKSEGFPTDAEGRTVNDRDYEHDKAAQQNTDQIARKYNGMAIEQVPVVSDEGIVYDGNGRTMAGQKAAKEGTDGEYINDLLENAENFGFTREQIEQSGIEHPRLVLVTDERLPYDTATFSKFNRNEKKTQSNTEQAVAKAKTLTSDEVGAIVAEIEGSGSLDAFFNNSKAINDLVKTLVDKGIIGQNEVAQMMDSPERLSAQGREYVKNLLLGSIFKSETIRMLGIDSAVKNKAINAIRSVMDNMKLGEFSLRDEIDQAIQLLYEARQGGNKVDTLLRTPDMFGEDAAKRYPSISQMMALALEGKVADFRGLLDKYNRIAASRNTGEGNMFEAAPTKEELINEYLNFKKRQDYGTGHSENEGGNDVSGIQEPKQETSGGNGSAAEGAEPERPKVKETDEKEFKTTNVSANPIEGIEKAADAFRKEQKQKGEFVMNLKLGKARQEYAEAKEHGEASEIKRTRDELKQLLDEHYKAQHMGLVQRRKEIAKEIGMTEAKKIDKPFSEMDSEEREYVANQNPLTESEIREQTSEENKNFIEDAVDYINGNHGFAQKMAYLKIYDDVRNRHENVSDNSGAENGTQLDAANTTGGEKLGLGRGRESGGSDGPVDRGTGNEAAPGEPEGREGNQNDTTLSVGKPGDKQGEGNSSDMGAVPSGNTDTKGSGSTGKDGNVSEQRGRESSNRPAKPDAKRKPAAKQGTTWRGRTGEEIKKNVADKKSAALAAIAELKKRKFGKGGSGHLGSFELLTPDQMEYVPTVMNAVKEYGMAIIDEGIYKVKDWFNHIRETFAGGLKDCGFTDQDIDDFIKEMWNSKMPMDGETHTIAEWCSIYGNAQLRKKLGEELDVKYQKQMDAEPIEVKIGDRKNIEETLPFLLPQQQEDVLKAETQFFGKEHKDREHAYGKGYMFTNGTGTGKTYTGLGIAKRLVKQGKGRILFVTPSQKKVNDWMKDGKNLGLNIRDLDSVAKEKGTTATTESGDGMVITTFANFGLNKKLLETEWDAVIYDECHRIMENKKGAETARSMQHYMMTNRDENHCFLRLQTINPHYQKMQNAADRFNELRQKEVQRIQKEYKQSHPSATAKDVVNATFSQLPKELNSFALADATAFPKLGKAYQDFTSAKQHYYNNVEPKLKEQAKNTWKNTKTIFLSATPFNTRENLDYAEGYIFKFPEDDGSRMSGRSRFYLDHFGAAYRYRYNRLEAKTDNPAAVAKQEVAFSDYLQDTLGTMSGRIIDSAYDYSRDFPTVAPDHADEFNNAVEEAVKGRYLGEAYSRTIGDYNYGSALFETMKVANIIQRMKDHLAAGRKIVVFHRRVETKNPIQPPFAYMLDYANRMIAEMKPGKERNEAIKECTEFRNKYADLLDWEQTLDYSMPREQIAKVFGRDNVLFFSGKESKKVKDKAVDTFNDDNSGKNIIVIQEASGKEGISLHDVTGNHQRVLITLGLPQSPITALQIEGRTYRIGNKSNAIFEYPILGLNSEMMLFGQKFNNQVSTTENLALGSQARNLRDSFANGILEHSGIIPIDQQGVGGKEFDAPKQSDTDPFDDAVLDYYSNQKLNKNNREGVDYFPTPEPLGYKMVEWANMGEGDTALEPSAGHGAIARYVSKSNELLSIEPSQSLFAKLQLKAGGLGRKFLNNTFENYNVANKHDVVVMNPPFGTAGATAIAHLDKAFKHLDEGGRVVAIIPRGSTDKKFDKWYGEQKNVAMRAEVDLPDIVFQQAGTNVRCRVVVLDKITDDTLRSKAGYPEKIDLSGHYDKIEDFFEDLRDVQMPDRIIDTQMKSMKKARTFKKDIEDIKGMTVTIEKNGISVFDKNAYRDYSISFPSIKHNEEWTKENYSKVYERFDQEQNRVYSENSKAALDEMKKLACKLAGMSEEEMQKYIVDKKDGGTHFREDRVLQYSKSDAKDVKNSRIIPEDVDKNVSSQIEKKFDDEVNSAKKELGITDGSFDKLIEDKVSLYADLPESEIIKDLEYDSNKTSQSGVLGQENPKLHNERSRRAEHQAARIAAKRELDYRKDRKSVLGNDYGLRQGDVLSPIQIEKCFKTILAKQGKSEEIERLFNKAIDICKRIGLHFNVLGESKNGSLGYSTTDREVGFNIDDLTKTKISSKELPVTILHEILHQMTLGSIDLVKRGKADGILTPKQIEAVNSILDIYNKVKDNRKQFEENTYGLTDEYEFAAQMADPRQRKALDLDIWDRIKNAAKELANKGDRSLWQTFKDAIKRLFEISDKDKMDEALNTIMGDFNETLDDIAMNEIDQDGFAYKLDNEEDRKLFDSLNNKRNTRKEYNDTVTELARRMAEGDRSISERTTGGMEETEKSVSSRREDWRGASMGRSYAGFNIRPKSIAHCAADIIANDVSRRGRTQKLSSTRKELELGQKGSMENSTDNTISKIPSWGITDERLASVGEREVSGRIENWAKQNNAWFDWRTLRGRFDRNKRLGTGDEAESDVFLSKDGKSVLKIVRNPHAIYDTLQGKLDSIALHNELFPTETMNVIGFTKVNEDGFSTTSVLLEQPFVEGKTVWDSFGTNEERIKFRDNFMKSLGFTKEKWAAKSGFFEGVPDDIWRKGDYAVEDVNARNIIIDKNGKGHIIDCVVSKYSDAIKDKIVYDSTEEKKQIQAENKAIVERLRREVKNQKLRLKALQEARNENSKDNIDEFIVDAKNKIADFEKQIKEKQNVIHFRAEESDSSVKISDKAPVVVKHVAEVAKKVGAKVQMVSSVDEITNKAAKAAIEEGRKITGWYDEKTGEVHLYMSNIHDRYTAEKTIWHEVVGHKGMRGLMRESFDKFLDSVWYDLDKPENAGLKKLVAEEMKYSPLDYRNAIEEGIARMAEEGKGEYGFWNGIKNKVSDFLHEIGYRIAPNTKDVKYLLWLSKNLQKNPNDPYWKLRAEAVKYRLDHEDIRSVVERNGMYFDNDGKNHDYLIDLNHKDFEEATDGKVHFRTTPTTASKIEEYNRRLATKLYAFKESTVDHMQSLQEAMEVISGEKDVWNNIPSSFNPLMAQNSMDSKVQQVSDSYDRKIAEPLGEVFQKVVALVDGENKDEQLRNAQLYMITKHGLERNRVFFVRDTIRVMKKDKNPNVTSLQAEWAKKHKDLSGELEQGKIRFDEYLNQMDEWIRSNVDISYVADEHDYSGFHGMQKKDINEKYDDKLAIDNVMSVESKLGGSLVKDFWSKKKAATDYIIDQQYTSGFADEVERDYLKGMFQWYVPLRKFDDTTAEDVYGYITEKGDVTNYVGPTLANAKGRSSLSDVNVLAQISAMAKASIINGGKNVVKQHLARFISAYENGETKNRIFVEINPWVEKHTIDGNEVWEEVTPQIPKDATQEQISDILQGFENNMKAKQASGDAKLLKNKADIGFKFQRAKDKSEHIVEVYIAGKKKSFVCQGNPRAAQAINGLLVDSGTRNAMSEIDAKITRKLAQFNTSLNPDFMSSNMLRDLTSASANVTKEGFGYTKDFLKAYAGNMRSIMNLSGRGNYLTMFRRYREDKLDMNNERDRMFKEFMDNGGQTGFVQIKKFEDLTKEYDNLIKKGNKDADRWLVKKIKKGLSFIEAANEIVEGIARYSTYCTSRKHGRSIGKSIYDAKEVSGNFNRHGSGDAIRTLKTEYDSNFDKKFRGAIGFFNSWMKNHTQFYNAGVQGANLLFKNYKSATITAAISFGFMPFGLGIAQALINQYLISREDEKDRNGVKDPYAELPEWKRRNNICIYWGHGKFKTIPLGIELRASFGIGDIAAGYVVNENLKSDTPIGYDILGQIAQLIPASDFLGHHSPSSSIKEVGEDVLLGVTPTTIKPFGELIANRDWTGRPFYRDKDYLDKAPRWKSAYDNTSDIYMTINKWANQSTNGIDASNPDMKGNETLDYLTAPYGWQHVIDSYTGGMGSTIRRTFDTGSAAIKGVVSGVKSEEGFGDGFSKEWSKLDKNQIPLYRVFNYTPSEGNNMQRTKSKWYNYTDEFNQIEYNLRQMRTDTPDLVKNFENDSKLYKFAHGDEGKAYNIWKAADDFIYKKRRDLKKTNDPVVKKSIEEQINIKMQEAVNDLDKLN